MYHEPKKKPAAKKYNANSEIRIRGVEPEVLKELEAVRALLNKPFDSQAVIHLIETFRSDRNALRQLQARNTDLHARIEKYVRREAEMIATIKYFIKQTNQIHAVSVKEAAQILTQFTGTLKRPGKAAAAVKKGKSVPPSKQGGLL